MESALNLSILMEVDGERGFVLVEVVCCDYAESTVVLSSSKYGVQPLRGEAACVEPTQLECAWKRQAIHDQLLIAQLCLWILYLDIIPKSIIVF
jgi:hypothetical protein